MLGKQAIIPRDIIPRTIPRQNPPDITLFASQAILSYFLVRRILSAGLFSRRILSGGLSPWALIWRDIVWENSVPGIQSGGIVHGDIVQGIWSGDSVRGIVSRGISSGGFCPGDYVRSILSWGYSLGIVCVGFRQGVLSGDN